MKIRQSSFTVPQPTLKISATRDHNDRPLFNIGCPDWTEIRFSPCTLERVADDYMDGCHFGDTQSWLDVF